MSARVHLRHEVTTPKTHILRVLTMNLYIHHHTNSCGYVHFPQVDGQRHVMFVFSAESDSESEAEILFNSTEWIEFT